MESLLNELPREDGASVWAPDSCKGRLLVSSSWFNCLPSPSWNFSHSECTCVLTHFCACVCEAMCLCASAQKTNLDFSSHWAPANSLGPDRLSCSAVKFRHPCLRLSRADRHLQAFIFILFLLLFLLYMGSADLNPVPHVAMEHFTGRTIFPAQFCSLKEKFKGSMHIHPVSPILWCC